MFSGKLWMTSFTSFTRCECTVTNHRTKYPQPTKYKRWKGCMSGSGSKAICTLGAFLFCPLGAAKLSLLYGFIVAFIDSWKYKIKWAGYSQILPAIADNDACESHNLSLQVILADLVRRLAQQMDITIDNITGHFLSLYHLSKIMQQ